MSALCPLPVLVQSLRAAAQRALTHPDRPLRDLGVAMERVLSRLERPCTQAALLTERLRDTLLALHEREAQLRLRLCADAGLRHADPQRAEAAEAALRLLPIPSDRALYEEAALLRDAELSPEVSLRVLTEAQALCGAALDPAIAARMETLDLVPLLSALAALRAQAAGLAARWVSARDSLAAYDEGDEGGAATLSHEEAAAVGLLLYYQAYARTATGPLHPFGDQPAERAALLEPIQGLPLEVLAEALRDHETQHPTKN